MPASVQGWIQGHSSFLLEWAAFVEVFSFFFLIWMMLTGRSSILAVFVYYQFMLSRAAFSARTRQVWHEADTKCGTWTRHHALYQRLRAFIQQRHTGSLFHRYIQQQQQQQRTKAE